jgi:preprotein translocase subunit SecG
MLTTLILVIHILVSIALILIILLQTGKGADIGAAFGGGSSQTVFGSTGATTFLSKVTIGAAVIFMCTSFILTYFSGKALVAPERSVVTEQSVPQVPSGTEGPITMPPGSKSEAPVPSQQSAPATVPENAPAPSGQSGSESPHSQK